MSDLALGALVFQLELAIGVDARAARKTGRTIPAWAPMLNEYSQLPGWARTKISHAIDWEIARRRPKWPHWRAGFTERAEIVKGKLRRIRDGGRRRIALVRRESSVRPDESDSADSIGGKIPLDRLVLAGVLVGDSHRWLERHAEWRPAPGGAGRVVIEIYEEAGAD